MQIRTSHVNHSTSRCSSNHGTVARFLILLVLACFALSHTSQAVSPPPDGCYPGFTTAEGCNALQHLTTGVGNTGVGWRSLFSAGAANFNTGVGAGTLLLNTADSNTAVGAAALLLNSTGAQNTAVGTDALVYNDSGSFNTANGALALFSNTTGGTNNAQGYQALFSNTSGDYNNAVGFQALYSNTGGNGNNAFGDAALYNNTGDYNTAIGSVAGYNLTTGSGNVCIGLGVLGVAGESNTTRIKNIYASLATARAVYVDADNKLGTLSSSRRFKEEIKPMDKASEALLALKPVTFRYKKEIDPGQALSFGLIAEEVAQINPELITRDEDGKPQTVRYEAVNAMLLNEFLKEHKAFAQEQRKVEKLENTVAGLLATVKEQAVEIQKVSAQVKVIKSASQVVTYEQ